MALPGRVDDYAPRRERRFARDGDGDGGGPDGRRTLLAFVFGICCFGMIAMLSIHQATSQTASLLVVRAGVAAVTEIDLLVDENYEALQAFAGETEEPTIDLTGFPIPITLETSEVLALDRQELRDRVLDIATARVYVNGLDAFETGEGTGAGFISVESLVSQLLELYSEQIHDITGFLAVLFCIGAIVSGVGLAAVASGYDRLRSPGLAAGFAALLGLAITFGIRFIVQGLAGSDPLYETFADLFGQSLDAGSRNFQGLFLGAAVLWALGFGLGLVDRYVLSGGDEDDPNPRLAAREMVPVPAPAPPRGPDGNPVESEPRTGEDVFAAAIFGDEDPDSDTGNS